MFTIDWLYSPTPQTQLNGISVEGYLGLGPKLKDLFNPGIILIQKKVY